MSLKEFKLSSLADKIEAKAEEEKEEEIKVVKKNNKKKK